MEILLKLLLILVAGGLDFFRGNKWPERFGTVKKVLLGGVLAYISGLEEWALLTGTILWAVSYANGWGSMLGAGLAKASGEPYKPMEAPFERWQALLGKVMPKVLVDPVLGLEMRGVLAFLYISPLMYFNIGYLAMLPMLMFAYSRSTNISAKFELFGLSHWSRYAVVRGLIIGVSAFVVSFCTG